ncbi:hypothetical protein GCM10023088_07310 [Actinomadura verrucosospora]
MGAESATLALRGQDVFLDEFGDVLYDDDAYVVSAGRYASWAWAWEHGSWLCVEDDELVRRVSADTTAVVLHANEKPMVEFRYAEDGRLVTGINTLLSLRPEDRTGSDPHRFDATLRALEADPDSNDYGPLGLPRTLLSGRRRPRHRTPARRLDQDARLQRTAPSSNSVTKTGEAFTTVLTGPHRLIPHEQ